MSLARNSVKSVSPSTGDPSPARARSWPQRLLRAAVIAVATVAVLAVVGLFVQVVAERRDAAAHPPPGDLVMLPDGRALHLQIQGEEHDGPTVILKAGAGGFSSVWAWVQPAVAKHYTVVSYDRAGLGWSDVSEHRPDADAVVNDLRAALETRDLPGPYVLVGHSLGAHYARAFAAAHPDDVAGVVLVDPSHEHQSAALADDYSIASMSRLQTVLRVATQLGVTRIYHPFAGDLQALPEPQRSQAIAEQATVRNVRAGAAEAMAVDQVGASVAGASLGDVPLRVLIAGSAPNEDGQAHVDALLPLRRDLAGLSSNGEATVLPDAEHVSIVLDPEHAAAVTEATLAVAEEAAAPVAATQ